MKRIIKRFLAWSTVVLPPTILILLSLAPLDVILLRLFGLFAAGFPVILLVALAGDPALKSQKSFRRNAVISVVLVFSIIIFNWPLRIAYALSRPAFDQVAEQAMTGETIKTPRRVGWFDIERIDVPGSPNNSAGYDVLCLWTDVHPHGNTGFVQASPDNLRFNLWSHFKLDETWQFIAED